MGSPLDALFEVIRSRRGADPASSRTARLFTRGRPWIARKVGEEAVEVVVAALAEDRQRLTEESADLLYHLLVLWAEAGLTPEDVWKELEARKGTPK